MGAIQRSMLLITCLVVGSPALADPVTVSQTVTGSATTTYNSRADWEAAVTGPLATITFEVDNQGQPFDTTGGFAHLAACCPSFATSLGDVMFSEEPLDSGDMNIAATQSNPGFTAWKTGNVLNALGGDTLTISLLNASGVAFDWQLWDTTPMTIRLSNGDSFTPALVPFQPTFFGVTSTEPIRWIEIGHHRSVLNLDNFADAAAPVPEPTTLTLLGLGIAGMAARRWRGRHPA